MLVPELYSYMLGTFGNEKIGLEPVFRVIFPGYHLSTLCLFMNRAYVGQTLQSGHYIMDSVYLRVWGLLVCPLQGVHHHAVPHRHLTRIEKKITFLLLC